MEPAPLILHIPHSSPSIPAEVREAFLLSEEELDQELLRLTDAYTTELFAPLTADFAIPLSYPVSRMVVDPERFQDDRQEPMAAHGLGVIYISTQDGRPLRTPPGQAEREQLLRTFYHPHHRLLTETVQKQLTGAGRSLIIDCHSFPEIPFPFEAHREKPRPEICIGTDAFHTPARLAELAAGLFRKAGYTVDFNHPFSGALVPLTFYRSNPHVCSLMIELNRKCYMNEQTGRKTAGFPVLQGQLAVILKQLKTAFVTL